MPLRPGQKHSGSFQPGYDPRRGSPERIANGKTLAQLAREHTEEALGILVEVINDPKRDDQVRIKAAQYILDRGWGKAPSHQTIAVEHSGDPGSMSTTELERRVRQLFAIDGEFTEVQDLPQLQRLSADG